jgi:GT2 family glycosyltransferase
MRARPITLECAERPRASIVIPVHGKVEYTWACLRSIAEQCAGLGYEVIVVDDASKDETPRLAEAARGLRMFRNAQNLGFVGSCNRGLAEARGDHVVFLNNDTRVQPGWLSWLLWTFEHVEGVGLVGSKLIYPDGRLQECGGIVFRDGSAWNYGRLGDPDDDRFEYLRDVDYVSGASIALPRALANELGGFDPVFAPAYYEDTDLAFRVRRAGKRVVVQPKSRVTHYEGVTAGTDTSQGVKRYQVVNEKTFFERWRDTLASAGERGVDIELQKERRVRRRVLVIDSYVPLPDQDSGSRRMDAVLTILQRLGDKVTFYPDILQYPAPYTDALRARGVEVITPQHAKSLRAHLEAFGANYAAVVVSRADVASAHLPDVLRCCKNARVAFDTVDLHHVRELREAELENDPQKRARALVRKQQELGHARSVDVTWVVSEPEKAKLLEENPLLNVDVVSNVHEAAGSRAPFEARSGLLFVGGYNHPPNVDAMRWFVAEVFPLVRARLPGVVLNVCGSNPPAEILGLACDDIRVHGWVQDLTPLLDGCRVSIAPLRVGAGVKGKVNEAMSYGLPVAATSIAVEGMKLRPGEDVMVGDRPEELADAIARVYEDRALWERLSAGGLRNVREHFGFDVAREALIRSLEAPRTSGPRARLLALAGELSRAGWGLRARGGSSRTSAADAEAAHAAGLEGLVHFYVEPSEIARRLADAPAALGLSFAWADDGEIRAIDDAAIDRHLDALLPALTDARATQVSGRPLLLVHRGLVRFTAARAARLRDRARAAGLPGLWLVALEPAGAPALDPRARGFDAVAELQPDLDAVQRVREGRPRLRARLEDRLRGVLRAPYEALARGATNGSWYASYPGLAVRWEEARGDDTPLTLEGATPAAFGRWLAATVGRVERWNAEHRLVFLATWDGAASGLVGDHAAAARLDATRAVITG